ncbi:MAG: trehalose-phosphatase [Thermomicrobiales bacterium]
MTTLTAEGREQVTTALQRCIDVLDHSPAALVTDIDGTISEVAPTPEEATVLPAARDALTRLQRSLAFVGVVTGRAASIGEALVDIPGLLVIGNHGLEWSDSNGVREHPEAVAAVDAIALALDEVQAAIDAQNAATGIIYENKRLSGTIHYRLAPDPPRAYATLTAVVGPIVERLGLRLTEGRFILELRPRVLVNKGTAVTDLIQRKGLQGIVFFGDDTTDVDAFQAVRAAREAGTLAGVRIGVTAAETPPAVIAESDVTVPGVDACAALLTQLADHFERVSLNA